MGELRLPHVDGRCVDRLAAGRIVSTRSAAAGWAAGRAGNSHVRTSHLTLGSGPLGGFALHLTGAGAAWTIVLSATATGGCVSLARIAIDLAPKPARILHALRLRHGLAASDLCPHCASTHA